MNCLFCNPEIIQRQKIWETDNEYILYNIRKTNKGRCLIVPKRHVENVRDLNDDERNSLFKTVQKVSKIVFDYLKSDGINYGFNEGRCAGQTVQHFHVHILPRYNNDPLPKYHLFHGDPKKQINLDFRELSDFVLEFKKIF